MEKKILIEQIKKHFSINGLAPKNLIDQFNKYNTPVLKALLKDKCTRNESEQVISTTLKNFYKLYLEHNYDISKNSELLASLANFIADERRLSQIDLSKLDAKTSQKQFYKIDNKLRQVIHHLTRFFIETYCPQIQTDKFPSFDGHLFEMIYQIYFHQYIVKDSQPLDVNRLNKLTQDICSIWMIRYLKQQTVLFNTSSSTLHSQLIQIVKHYPYFISYKLDENEKEDLCAKSVNLFFEKITLEYFLPKVPIERFLRGIVKNTLYETSMRKKDEKDDQLFNSYSSNIELKIREVSHFEVLEFINEALNAIEHKNNGNARALLLLGRNTSLFNKLIIESFRTYSNSTDQNKVKKSLVDITNIYTSKGSENEQRKRCKKALLDWMYAQSKDPNSVWYLKASKIIEYILQTPKKDNFIDGRF